MPNDKLSRACTVLYKLNADLDGAAEDLALFGASDCMDLVNKGASKRARRALMELGYDDDEALYHEIAGRSTPRVAHDLLMALMVLR